MCVLVGFSPLMHLYPFINHTEASGLGSLERGAEEGWEHITTQGKFQENRLLNMDATPVFVTTSLQLLHKTGFGGKIR